MDRELAETITENDIVYRLAGDGLYYPDLKLLERTHYSIGKYGLMRWEYLQENYRREYFKMLRNGRLNEHLHEVTEACHVRMELLVERMKAEAGIAEELKATDPMKWVGLVNNIINAAEEIVLGEMLYL